MRLTAVVSALVYAAYAAAQNTTIQIQVGAAPDAPNGPFQFTPPMVNATKGSTVTFTFTGSPGNHSITQSSFATPCQQMEGGFSSGFILIPAGATDNFPSWNLTIEDDSAPIWFFCAQLIPSPHCFAGMVGAINAPTSGNRSFDAFVQNVQAAASNGTAPTQPVGALSGSGAVATAAPGPLTGSITGFATPAGSAPAASGSSGGASGSGSSSGSAPSPTSSGSGGGSSSAATISANTLLVLLVGLVGGVALF
ncbi:hypothetical protein K474DRAFT_1671019 [Panus rudis PR-1116 ss-1]|nr:hypothetical protein K474DRAFT_1671019 [Panus rudis PR-1116 ss-1]